AFAHFAALLSCHTARWAIRSGHQDICVFSSCRAETRSQEKPALRRRELWRSFGQQGRTKRDRKQEVCRHTTEITLSYKPDQRIALWCQTVGSKTSRQKMPVWRER